MKGMSVRLGLLLAALVVALAACGGGGAAPTKSSMPAGDATKGAQVFAGTCSACHGPDAKGLPGLGKDMTISTFIKGLSDDDFIKFLKVGRPTSDKLSTTGVDMPPKGGNPALTDQDLANVIAYIRTLNKP